MKSLPFKMKLIGFAFLVGVLPLLILGLISYSRASTAVENAIYRGNEVFLENAIIKIDNYFKERSGDAEVISSAKDIKEALEDPNFVADQAHIDYMQHISETYGYSFLNLTDEKGHIILANSELVIGADLSERDYMIEALKGNAVWSELFYSSLIDKNTLTFAYPIKEGSSVIGTLVIVIDQDVVNNLIHSGVKSLGTSGDAYLVDENLLLHTETLLGDLIEDASLKESVDSEGTRRLAEALKSGNESFRSVGTYPDYLENPVLGALGIVHVGGEELGIVIEVDVSEAMVPVFQLRTMMLTIFAVVLTVVIVVTLILMRVIIRPIRKINDMLYDISEGEGDLTKKLVVNSNDEFGKMADLFNIFIDKLRVLISDVTDNAINLSASAAEISATIDDNSRSLEEINHNVSSVNENITNNASVTQETNASVEENASSSAVMSEKAMEVAENSSEVLEATNHGKMSLEKAKASVESVQELSNNMETVIGSLNESTDKIGEIVNIITSIADQVNLLALNAAIEAARAGEHGKGFAVVADEVRKLAEESRESASSITELVEEIVSQSALAMKSVEDEKRQVSISVSNINDTQNEMENIVELVSVVSSNIDNISKLIEDQTSVNQDISNAMDQITHTSVESASSINDITMNIQNQSAAFEEITASMQELNSMSDMLQEEMSKFKVRS